MKSNHSVLFLTRYDRLGASSRYRFLQYLSYFESHGLECHVSPLFDDYYLRRLYETGRGGLQPIFKALQNRLTALLYARKYSLVVLEKEVFPYFPAMFEQIFHFLGIPYIVDYDDAIFHQYDQHSNVFFRFFFRKKIAHVMRNASVVIAGNKYLAKYAQNAGALHYEILPTVVDLSRYSPREVERSPIFTIGWIGSPSSSAYLKMVNEALSIFCARRQARVVLVGAGKMELTDVPMEIRQWSEETEIDEIYQFDVGLMPLPDNGWARGKCGFKIIQYMACGIPVIASPVGENSNIVEPNLNGFLPEITSDWVKALEFLYSSRDLRRKMGEAGRSRVEEHYCLSVTAPKFLSILNAVLDQTNSS